MFFYKYMVFEKLSMGNWTLLEQLITNVHNLILFDIDIFIFLEAFHSTRNGIYCFSQLTLLKGSLTRDFQAQVFSWISVPRAHKYSIEAVLNFFENSQRYLRINVYRRCKRHRRKIYCWYWSQITKKPIYLSQVSTTPPKNCSPVSTTPPINFLAVSTSPANIESCQY